MFNLNTSAVMTQNIGLFTASSVMLLYFIVNLVLLLTNRDKKLTTATRRTICIIYSGMMAASLSQICSTGLYVILYPSHLSAMTEAITMYDAGTLPCICPTCGANGTAAMINTLPGQVSCTPALSVAAYDLYAALPVFGQIGYIIMEDLTIIRVFSAIIAGVKLSRNGQLGSRLSRVNLALLLVGVVLGLVTSAIVNVGAGVVVLSVMVIVDTVTSCILCYFAFRTIPDGSLRNLKTMVFWFGWMRLVDILVYLLTDFCYLIFNSPAAGASCSFPEVGPGALVNCNNLQPSFGPAFIATLLAQIFAFCMQIRVLRSASLIGAGGDSSGGSGTGSNKGGSNSSNQKGASTTPITLRGMVAKGGLSQANQGPAASAAIKHSKHSIVTPDSVNIRGDVDGIGPGIALNDGVVETSTNDIIIESTPTATMSTLIASNPLNSDTDEL